MVMTQPNQESEGSSVPESDNPLLDLHNNSEHCETYLKIGSDIELDSSQSLLLPMHQIVKSANHNTTHCRKVFKNYRDPTNHQQFLRFGSLTKQQK